MPKTRDYWLAVAGVAILMAFTIGFQFGRTAGTKEILRTFEVWGIVKQAQVANTELQRK